MLVCWFVCLYYCYVGRVINYCNCGYGTVGDVSVVVVVVVVVV